MAIIYGEVDCLNRLLKMQKAVGVKHINTLEDLLSYRNECDESVRQAEIGACKEFDFRILKKEESISRCLLAREVNKKEGSLLQRPFTSLFLILKLFILKRNLKNFNKNREAFVRARIQKMSGKAFESKTIFDENYNLLQGALGEVQALYELKKLPDSCFIVNDLQLRFSKPLYEPRSQQRIYSIQADHVVLTRAGIFLVETKNWSRKVANRESDFNAYDQVKRTNFALYCFLNPRRVGLLSFIFKKKEVKVRSILLMTGEALLEQEKFVKVLTLSDLKSYISYFPPVLTERELKGFVLKLIKGR